MLPSRKRAHEMLEEAYLYNPGPWREHSIVVAESAYTIARYCDEMNPEKAYVVGLLHDIGRRAGISGMLHIIEGYRYLTVQGYEEAAKICITHSFATQDMAKYIGKIDVSKEEYQIIRELLESYIYDDYDRLIQVCDSIALPSGTTNIEIRLGDIKKRYGYYPLETWNKNIELKLYFENKVGKSFEEIFML